MRRLTKERWFRPRRLGFGWQPVSWQGWLVTLVFIAGEVALLSVLQVRSERLGAAGVVFAAFLVVAYLTSRVSPGDRGGDN